MHVNTSDSIGSVSTALVKFDVLKSSLIGTSFIHQNGIVNNSRVLSVNGLLSMGRDLKLNCQTVKSWKNNTDLNNSLAYTINFSQYLSKFSWLVNYRDIGKNFDAPTGLFSPFLKDRIVLQGGGTYKFSIENNWLKFLHNGGMIEIQENHDFQNMMNGFVVWEQIVFQNLLNVDLEYSKANRLYDNVWYYSDHKLFTFATNYGKWSGLSFTYEVGYLRNVHYHLITFLAMINLFKNTTIENYLTYWDLGGLRKCIYTNKANIQLSRLIFVGSFIQLNTETEDIKFNILYGQTFLKNAKIYIAANFEWITKDYLFNNIFLIKLVYPYDL